MKHRVALVALAGAGLLALASPAMAHPGPHDDPNVVHLFAHLFTDGFHVAQVGLALMAGFAGLGLWRIVRAARGERDR